MNIAKQLVSRIVGEHDHDNVPARVREIVERHRQNLLQLAHVLLASGRTEEEVIAVIEQASESFSSKVRAETQGLQL